MAIVTGDRYSEKLVKFVEEQAGPLIEGALVLKLNPAGLHYVQSRLEALHELESLLTGAPVDYLRAYVSDLGDHRALEQLRRMLRLLTSLKVVSVLPPPLRDPTPLSLLPFGRLRILELRGCDLSTSAARGLLELRLTLEKIICHNSTDALRHVFASRIVEVKDSPQWNKLSFVSCACNGLILMDESLQLLPAVETLDLSRNKFAKIDNLRKCVKLKHLDLGFNHLRAVASFTQVSHIIKLVLRNNALTSLRGVENLKSLEGLDVSYNIISNFSELEYLVGISSLQNLWLEGNPLCCARWYRAHVFGLFSHPDRLKLDDKGICNREFWKRKIIIASRQKRPASFGFYSPAEDGAQGEGSINRKKKMVPRIASIQSEEESTYFCSDQEYASCDNETQSRDEAALSDDEAEMVDLMNKIELVKKENSALWLREFEDRMHYAPANTVNGNISRATLHPWKENYVKNRKTPQHLGECSRYISPDSIQASGDESSTNIVESENSFVDMSTGLSTSHYFGLDGSLGHDGEVPLAGKGKSILKESYGGTSSPSIHMKSLDHLSIRSLGGHANVEHVRKSPLNVIDDMSESYTSSIFPGSPPHYQEDILHRRHNLMEEILQLSAESYSVPSSDSNSTGSEDDIFPFGPLMLEVIEPTDDKALNGSAEGHLSLNHRKSNNFEQCCEFPLASKNGSCLFDSSADQTSCKQKPIYPGFSVQLPSNVVPADAHAYEIDHCVKYENSQRRKRENKKKLKKRVVSLLEYTSVRKTDTCESNQDVPGADNGSEQETESFIENYFNLKIADSGANETCRQYLKCICILDSELVYREREVVLLLSSKNKLYILIVGAAEDGSGTMLILLACHSVEDIREVFVGLGLQVVRVCMEKGINFLFVTKSIEKSRQLLSTLQVSDISTPSDKYFLRSVEQFQVELFEKQICGGVKVSIFQYSMVFFCCSEIHGEMWHPRSLFIIEGHLLVCIEDLMQFGSFSKEASLPPYFVLDSCCLIADLFEMVVEVRRAWCSTLSLKCAKSEFSLFPKYDEEFAAVKKKNSASSSLKWEFKWVSEESLFNFIAVVKAIYLSSMGSPLLVRYLS